jgi:hypothetical protein
MGARRHLSWRAVVEGLIDRDAGGYPALTDRRQVVLRAMLPEL